MYLSKATILNLSLEIERRGVEFYRAMKKRSNDPFIDYMIEAEQGHIEDFKKLFDKNDQKSTADGFENPHLDDDYLIAAYSQTEIFSQVDPESVKLSVLYDVAIAMEKDAVAFYTELVETLGEKYPAETKFLHDIRSEERKHIRELVAKKKTLGQNV